MDRSPFILAGLKDTGEIVIKGFILLLNRARNRNNSRSETSLGSL